MKYQWHITDLKQPRGQHKMTWLAAIGMRAMSLRPLVYENHFLPKLFL
jgi:hypothetical protein